MRRLLIGILALLPLFNCSAQLITRAQLVPLSNYVDAVQASELYSSNYLWGLIQTVSGGGTNHLVQIAGANLGSAGTVNWASGVSGVMVGNVVTLSTEVTAANLNVVSNMVITGSNTLRSAITELQNSTNSLNTRVGNLEGSTNGLDALVRTKQNGSSILTNLTLTGVITNVVNGFTNGSGNFGLLGPTNNGDVRVKGLTAGANITLTDQTTNINIAVNGVITTLSTNGNQFGAVLPITIKDFPYITNLTDFATSRVNNIIVSNQAYIVNGSISNNIQTNDVSVFGSISNLTTTNATVRAGGSTSNAFVGGRVFVDLRSLTNCCASGTTNLLSYTIRAHMMTNTGDTYLFTTGGRFSLTGQSKEIIFQYGTPAQTILDTGSQAVSNGTWTAWMMITRENTTNVSYLGFLQWDRGVIGGSTNVSGMLLLITNGLDNLFQIQGSAGAVSSITNKPLFVDYFPGPR